MMDVVFSSETLAATCQAAQWYNLQYYKLKVKVMIE